MEMSQREHAKKSSLFDLFSNKITQEKPEIFAQIKTNNARFISGLATKFISAAEKRIKQVRQNVKVHLCLPIIAQKVQKWQKKRI